MVHKARKPCRRGGNIGQTVKTPVTRDHGGAKVIGDHGGHQNGKNQEKFNVGTRIMGSSFNTLNDIIHEERNQMNGIDDTMIGNNNIGDTSRLADPKVMLLIV